MLLIKSADSAPGRVGPSQETVKTQTWEKYQSSAQRRKEKTVMTSSFETWRHFFLLLSYGIKLKTAALLQWEYVLEKMVAVDVRKTLVLLNELILNREPFNTTPSENRYHLDAANLDSNTSQSTPVQRYLTITSTLPSYFFTTDWLSELSINICRIQS